MSAAYYLDAVYVLLLDSARNADYLSGFGGEDAKTDRVAELHRILGIEGIEGDDVAGMPLDDEGFDFSDLPPPGEFIPGVNDIREGPRSGRADIIQLRDATERINRGGVGRGR